MRIHVESWSADYGPAVDLDEEFAPEDVEVGVETDDWRPLPGAGELPPLAAFVDGVRRIDARITADDPETGPVPGICGSFAVGSVLWDSVARRSWIEDQRVGRVAVICRASTARFPELPPPLEYRQVVLPDTDPNALVQHLHAKMRQAEAELGRDLAAREILVITDGRIQVSAPPQVLGFVKRQLMTYLPPKQACVVGALAPSERTPLFRFGGAKFLRYSWYLRLATVKGGHSWSGIARCECSGLLSLESAVALADLSALLLPRFASAPHIDPRAPQNLVPIGALEKRLRRMLGDQALINRLLRSAVAASETTS